MASDIPAGVGTRSFEELVRMTAVARELAEALAPFTLYDPLNCTAGWDHTAPVSGFTLGDVRRAKAGYAKARAAGLVP